MRRRGRLLVVSEVDVHRLCAGTNALGERAVGGLAPAQVPERGRMVEVVLAHCAGFRQPVLDALPRRMLEVERDAQAGPERAEDELDRALVPYALQRDADGAEPVVERS